MTEYHTIYKGLEGESTQWEDIQRRLGNLPPKAPVWKPDAYKAEEEGPSGTALVDTKEAEELSDLEDEFQDDRVLEKYRLKRMEELRREASRPRFGTVEQIRGSEFVEQVSQAGHEVWVVLLLEKDGNPDCGLLYDCLKELAEKYPHTKFLRSIATDCIPNYPDRNLPTVLVYHDTRCVQTIVGLSSFGGRRVTPELVALTLNKHGPICADGDDDEEATQQKHIKEFVKRVVSTRDEDDEDSDFD